eukprot:scaffold19889_cov76-Phaeocystis_antarctica.AAC.1
MTVYFIQARARRGLSPLGPLARRAPRAEPTRPNVDRWVTAVRVRADNPSFHPDANKTPLQHNKTPRATICTRL